MLAVIPQIVGMLYTSFLPEERKGILLNWGAGFVILWGIFEIIALPLIFLRQSLDDLCMIYGGVIVLLAIAALLKGRKDIAFVLKKEALSIKDMSLIEWGNLVLILGQAYVYVRYTHIDEDDAFYVGAAVSAVSTNTIFSINPYTGMEYAKLPARYVLSPFFSFSAFLSKITGVHPAVTAHVVLAAVLIVLSYAVYKLLGMKMFPDNSEYSDYFLLFVIVIVMFSGYTVYTQGMFALVRIWQGKAVLCAILVPFIFYMMLHLYLGQAVAADWCFLFLLMCACCMVSSMGIMLGAIMLGIFGFLNVIRNKNIKELCCTLLCCVPNLICAGIYLIIR